jgi:hypothetical protein
MNIKCTKILRVTVFLTPLFDQAFQEVHSADESNIHHSLKASATSGRHIGRCNLVCWNILDTTNQMQDLYGSVNQQICSPTTLLKKKH